MCARVSVCQQFKIIFSSSFPVYKFGVSVGRGATVVLGGAARCLTGAAHAQDQTSHHQLAAPQITSELRGEMGTVQ